MIEQLTYDERGALHWYGKHANQVGQKALRIIDALTAENAALRAEVERLRAEHYDLVKTHGEHVEARFIAESRLGAVQAWLDAPGRDEGERMFVELRAILAAQPAAPLLRSTTDQLPPGCHCPPDKCMAPRIMGRQMPCRRQPEAPALMRNPLDPKFKAKNEG